MLSRNCYLSNNDGDKSACLACYMDGKCCEPSSKAQFDLVLNKLVESHAAISGQLQDIRKISDNTATAIVGLQRDVAALRSKVDAIEGEQMNPLRRAMDGNNTRMSNIMSRAGAASRARSSAAGDSTPDLGHLRRK